VVSEPTAGPEGDERENEPLPGLLDYLRSSASGLIAGASDVDPTTVATMAVIGATTVYGLSWLAILVFPILAVIQAISSRIGVVTHEDLQYLVKRRFGRVSQLLLLGSILVVTVITIAADLEAGAAALGLLTHLPGRWFVIPLAALVLGLLFVGSYDELQGVLRYVLLLLLAYVVAAFLAHPDWSSVLRHTLVPTFTLNKDYIAGALALLGTTLTSYVYVWQTIEEAEDKRPLAWLRLEEADAVTGIFFAVAVMWFILIATAATLGVHHPDLFAGVFVHSGLASGAASGPSTAMQVTSRGAGRPAGALARRRSARNGNATLTTSNARRASSESSALRSAGRS